MKIREYRTHFVIFLSMFCLACGPRQGYPGPERPLSEVSVIRRGSLSSDILFGSGTVDGLGFSSFGVAVLPGRHTVAVQWRLKGPKLSCESYGDFDSSGFDYCRKRQAKGKVSSCSCWDYLQIYEKCQHEVVPVTCSEAVETEAGATYDVVPTGDLSSPQVEGISPAGGWLLGCTKGYGSYETFETYRGSGQVTAQQAGVFAPWECFS